MRKLVFGIAAIWVTLALYTIWAYNTVFPIKDVPLVDGKTKLALPILPFDTYSVSFLVSHGTVGPRQLPEVREEVKLRNSEHPIMFTAKVSALHGTITKYTGTTKNWILGGRHNLSPSMKFDDYFQLYSLKHEITFDAMPFERYTLELNTNDTGGVSTTYPVTIFVAGDRDDGYYPIGPIVFLVGSAVFFVAIVVLSIIVKFVVSMFRRA